ncbi:MAG: hypothetical protein KC917_24090, partial [Candidatus Omnitrophica bacterium]|nr:hypothetical protein [Candidatus Omnitrophota bacterium]
LPFLLFKEIPLIGGAAVPRRFAEIVVLVVSLLAAEGFKTLSLRLGSRQVRRTHFLFVIGLIGLFLTIEQWKFIYPATPEPISPFYTEFLEPDSNGAILELPIDYNNESRHYGYYQTRHGRPILSAIIGRVPKQAHEYVKNNPLIIQLQSDLPGTSQLDNADFQDGF